nr:hypothetical protein [Tanacetum cinerariifolium]
DAEVAESEGRHAAQQVKKQAEIYNLDLDHSLKVLSMQKDDSKVQEVVEEEIDRDHDGFNKDIDWDAAMDHVNQRS